ncbi:hypothetical protein CEXT_425461 [Caerostris extrusa]|uniref:Uncharacterized protein n=1 Tax=Caerostris extrusa TaxID=172846 RepID=A0AAV4VDI4_CAEEX|nr:hypothetical protein CEXT_425461 [Caerostris extrusa]
MVSFSSSAQNDQSRQLIPCCHHSVPSVQGGQKPPWAIFRTILRVKFGTKRYRCRSPISNRKFQVEGILKSLKLPQPPHGNFTNHRLSNKMIQLVQEEEKEVSRTEPKENMIVYHSNSK